MRKIAREAQSVEEALAMMEMMEGGNPDIRQALVELVKRSEVVVAISTDGQVVFQAAPTLQ